MKMVIGVIYFSRLWEAINRPKIMKTSIDELYEVSAIVGLIVIVGLIGYFIAYLSDIKGIK
jgi:preprotein translocase subunit Sss1